MILRALYDYYQRKADDPDPARRLPAFGLEEKEIPFIIELSADGRPLMIKDTRYGEGKKKTAMRYRVPIGVKKASGVAANLLWDNAEYVLGIDTRGNPKRVADQHAAFRARLTDLPEASQQDAGMRAIDAFYTHFGAASLEGFGVWTEITESNPVLTFRLDGEDDLICQRPALQSEHVVEADAESHDPSSDERAVCLITGLAAKPARLHTSIKGVRDAQSSGANIVSFNLDASSSFNKTQGNNAPVSEAAAFAYTTALNHLLAKDSRQRVQVGDASTVFWAQKKAPDIENGFALLCGVNDPDAQAEQMRALLSAIHSGKFKEGVDNPFYVLGLSPNAARIAIRFWYVAPVSVIAERIGAWFKDLQIVRGAYGTEYPSLYSLLKTCAAQGKPENIPPNLGGEVMRSILSGGRLPATWLNAAVRRCRVEQDVNYLRAAIIKVCLNRLSSHSPSSDLFTKELMPMLDPDNLNPAYRLGRLFAVLEKAQEEANPNLNATIRDRYYGAASSAPVSVFTTLLRLKNHHLGKLHRGCAKNLERLIGEIMDGLDDFPKQLNLPEQGRFALGYYHQRQALFVKSETATSTSTIPTEGE